MQGGVLPGGRNKGLKRIPQVRENHALLSRTPGVLITLTFIQLP